MILSMLSTAISAVTSVVAAVTPVIASVGSSVASFCTTVLPKVVPVLIGGLEKLNTFVGVIQAAQVFVTGEAPRFR